MTTTPAPHPCAAHTCDMFVSATASARYCDRHRDIGLDDFANLAEWLDAWTDDHAHRDNPADRYAQILYGRALDYLHGFVIAMIYGDADLADYAARASALFGYRKCDTCGDLTPGDELDVNEMCGSCRDDLDESHPCHLGHFDCSTTDRGECSNETADRND